MNYWMNSFSFHSAIVILICQFLRWIRPPEIDAEGGRHGVLGTLTKLNEHLQEVNKKTAQILREVFHFCDHSDSQLRNEKRITSKVCFLVQSPLWRHETRSFMPENIGNVQKVEGVDSKSRYYSCTFNVYGSDNAMEIQKAFSIWKENLMQTTWELVQNWWICLRTPLQIHWLVSSMELMT